MLEKNVDTGRASACVHVRRMIEFPNQFIAAILPMKELDVIVRLAMRQIWDETG